LDRLFLDFGGCPFLVAAPAFWPYHPEVRALHLELLERARASTEAWYEDLADELLWAQHEVFYRAIGDAMGIVPSELSAPDRHRLFIATEAIHHQGQSLPGLSWLEQLMGYEYDLSGPTSGPPPLTSGDGDADLIAACHLILGDNAIPYMERFSRPKLLKILEQCNNLSNREEIEKERQEATDRAAFAANETAIAAQAKAMGVTMQF
jgi:hypothetical protein